MTRRPTTILAADVVGFSRLMAVDEAGTLAALQALRKELFEPKSAQYGGRTIKLMGDGTLMEFTSVVDAVAFAVEFQCAMRARNAEIPEKQRIDFRIGINIGDIIDEGDDIYGDGVNIAARLEGLAKPNGICISEPVHTQIKGKLHLTFEDLGEQRLKNIPDPVTVCHIQLDDKAMALVTPMSDAAEVKKPNFRLAATTGLLLGLLVIGGLVWWQPWNTGVTPGSGKLTNAPLPDKTSIAVLPFKNLSNDPEQTYFVDGITGDLVTDLSKFAKFRVASRSATTAYKGKSVDVRQASQELGVKYIVEGSVEKTAGRLRVTTQLVEAASGTQLWAQRFDRELVDLFVVRDEIRAAIIGALVGSTGVISNAEQKRASQTSPDRLTAHDLFYRANVAFQKFNHDANEEARRLLEKSIALDPDHAGAHALLGWVHWRKYWSFFVPGNEGSLNESIEQGRKVVQLDRSDYNGHWLLGASLRLQGDNETAKAAYERAFKLNPNDPDLLADWAEFLSFSGQPDKAITQVLRAVSLNPTHPDWYLSILGRAYFNTKQYKQAIQIEKRIVGARIGKFETLAASYALLDRIDEAKLQIAKLLERRPSYSIKEATADNKSMEAGLVQHLLDGLRKTGLPEQ